MEDLNVCKAFEFFQSGAECFEEVSIEEYDEFFEIMKNFLIQKRNSAAIDGMSVIKVIEERTGINANDKNSLDTEDYKQKIIAKKNKNRDKENIIRNEIQEAMIELEKEKNFQNEQKKKLMIIQNENMNFHKSTEKCMSIIKTYYKFVKGLGVQLNKNGNIVKIRDGDNLIQLEPINEFKFKPTFIGKWTVFKKIDYIFWSEIFPNFLRLIKSDESV